MQFRQETWPMDLRVLTVSRVVVRECGERSRHRFLGGKLSRMSPTSWVIFLLTCSGFDVGRTVLMPAPRHTSLSVAASVRSIVTVRTVPFSTRVFVYPPKP